MMPIFTMLIFVAFVFLIVIILSKVFGSRVWTARLNQWIVLGYIALGLISIGILSFTTNGEGKYSMEERKQIFEDQTLLWNTLLDGQTNPRYEGYIQKEWQMDLTSDQYRVIPHLDTDIKVDILVERRDDPNSNIIYAKTYAVPYQYRGVDFTNRASLDYFEFENNILRVNPIPNQEFHFYEINPILVMLDQFKGNIIEDEAYYSFSTGRTILFLNVPSHVNIIDESGYIYFVR